MRLHNPQLTMALLHVSEYFQRIEETVPPSNEFLRMYGDTDTISHKSDQSEESKRFIQVCSGDFKLLTQIAAHKGLVHDLTQSELSAYLTGEDSLVVDMVPELAIIRDVVFILKLLLNPHHDCVPMSEKMRFSDTGLKWSHSNISRLEVSGFARKTLLCIRPAWSKGENCGGGYRFWSFLRGKSQPRCPPSAANPSVLAGEHVETEDDILHLKSVPTFDGALRERDSELLLQYLTAPYLRIPLILQFFASPDRITALRVITIQNVLDACLFESGDLNHWRTMPESAFVEEIPARTRECMSTCSGMLFHNLIMSPTIVLQSLERIYKLSLEQETGSYRGSGASIILYTAKMLTRIQSYISSILKSQVRERPGSAGAKDEQGCVCKYIESLQCTPEMQSFFSDWLAKIEPWLDTLVGIIERWRYKASKDGNKAQICRLHAHILYVLKNKIDYNWRQRDVVLSLSATIYLSMTLSSSILEDDLGFSHLEIYEAVESVRQIQYDWLLANPEASDALNKVVAAVSDANAKTEATMNTTNRKWKQVPGNDFQGRFAPIVDIDLNLTSPREYLEDMPIEALAKEKLFHFGRAADSTDAEEYKSWLRKVSTQSVALEINVQTGSLSVKKHSIQILPKKITQMSVFKEAWGLGQSSGKQHHEDIWQCAEVTHHVNRQWYRLMHTYEGTSYDVILWTPDNRTFEPLEKSRAAPSMLSASELWAWEMLKPYTAHFLTVTDGGDNDLFSFFIQEANISASVSCVFELATKKNGDDPDSKYRVVKEILVHRNPSNVSVFDVALYGRRRWSRCVFSSDARSSMHTSSLTMHRNSTWMIGDGRTKVSPEETLIVRRTLANGEQETFIPSEFLHGILPDALLEQYCLWERPDGCIIGYDNSAGRKGTLVPAQQLTKALEVDMSKSAVVKTEQQHGQYELVNLLGGRKCTLCTALMSTLLRVEHVSHILVWGRRSTEGCINIRRIFMPRLKLSFTAKTLQETLNSPAKSPGEGEVLVSDVHEDVRFLTFSGVDSCNLIQGIPFALLLKQREGNLSVIIPKIGHPESEANSSGIVVKRHTKSSRWCQNLQGDARYYIYEIHPTGDIMSMPSLSGQLMVMAYYWATRKYKHFARSINNCYKESAALSGEEMQLWRRMGVGGQGDHHPDAHACRLLLAYQQKIFATNVPTSWNVVDELQAYFSKLELVSDECRLTLEKEASLLWSLPHKTLRSAPVLLGRRAFLASLKENFKLGYGKNKFRSSTHVDVLQKFEHTTLQQVQYKQEPFDNRIDESCITGTSAFNQMKSKLCVLNYSQPTTGKSLKETIEELHVWMNGDFDLMGLSNGLGFLFFYELLTNTLDWRLTPQDSSHELGCLLLRFLPDKIYNTKGILMSTLRVLSLSEELATTCPAFEDTRGNLRVGNVFPGDESVGNLYTKLQDKLGSCKSVIWPKSMDHPMEFVPRTDANVSDIRVRCREGIDSLETWNFQQASNFRRNNFQIDTSCLSECDALAPAALMSSPLSSLLKDDMVVSDVQMKGTDSNGCEFVMKMLKDSSASESLMGMRCINRLREDLNLLKMKNESSAKQTLKGFRVCDLNESLGTKAGCQRSLLFQLRESLELMHASDTDIARTLRSETLSSSNITVDARHEFNKLSNREISIDLGHLVSALLSEDGENDLVYWNPAVSTEVAKGILNKVALLLLVSNRILFVRMTLRTLGNIQNLLQRVEVLKASKVAESTVLECASRAHELYCQLSVKRYICTPSSSDRRNQWLVDPRFLVFESFYGILLKEKQVSLALDLANDVRRVGGSSRVFQMLMGSGKTTVLMPLLSLLLADGSNLVVSVFPRPILPFSAAILRERFGIVGRPVVHLDVERTTFESTLDIVARLNYVRRFCGIVVCHPSALKSIILRVVEVLHLFDQSHNISRQDEESKAGFFNRVKRVVISNKSGDPLDHDGKKLTKRIASILRVQAVASTALISMMRKYGIIVVDEVDTVLHPLRSELNWPLGKKVALDLGFSKIEEDDDEEEPIETAENDSFMTARWNIPLHLIDGLLSSTPISCENSDRRPALVYETHKSKVASKLLAELADIIKEGAKENDVQLFPHLQLLRQEFYHEKLKSRLIVWLMIFVRKQRLLTGICEDSAINYL